MTTHNYVQRLNWRLILIHSIGTWFFIHALPTLSYLYDVTLYKATITYSFDDEEKLYLFLADNGHTAGQFMIYLFYVPATWIIGLVLGVSVSLYLTLKYKWLWLNSMLVLVIMALLKRFDLTAWTLLRKVFLLPGKLFDNSTLYLLTNGLFFLGAGFFLFFFKSFIEFIERNNARGESLSPKVATTNKS